MTLLQKLHRSFVAQLTLWVAGFVLVITGIVIVLLVRFSLAEIKGELVETTRQALENTALRINNTLRQAAMAAHLEHQTFTVDKALVVKLISENKYLSTLNLSLPHAQLSIIEQPEEGRKSNYRELSKGGTTYYQFFEPIYQSQYGIMITCPAEDFYGQFYNVQLFLLVTCFVGIIIMLLVCWIIIKWHLKPLDRLADSAQHISEKLKAGEQYSRKGLMAEAIPDSLQKDEVGQLQNSLAKMQRSLANYMDEMQKKKEALSHQNTELQKAYSEAKEYENLKAMFLQQMTDQIDGPVEMLSKDTNRICDNYHQLTKAEMSKIQIEILLGTEQVTQLLDQLLNAPAQKKNHVAYQNPKTAAL